MKMKKLARVFTSAVLVSAMVATMGGMTSFAAVESIGLTKTVVTDGQTFAPNTSFVFNLANGTDKSLTGEEYGAAEGQTLKVYQGVSEALRFNDKFTDNGKLKFTPEEGDGANLQPSVSTDGAALLVNASVFTEPGIYHYTVQEVDSGYEGIVYDTALRHIYLYVNYGVNEDGSLKDTLEVGHVVVSKEVDGEEVKVGGYELKEGSELNNKGIEFINNYGDDVEDPDNPKPYDPNDSTHDITIGKTVSGNQGDKNKVFNFTVTVNGASGEKYKVVKGDNVLKALVSGNSETYQLKHGETIKITGLTENDSYTVVETEADADGYTTTYARDDEKTIEKNDAEGNKIQVVIADGATYTVTNDRDVTTPTGIVLSFAPYILLVALAGVFGVLFLRRKKEEF